MITSLPLFISDNSDKDYAEKIALKTKSNIVYEKPQDALYLSLDENGLSLTDGDLCLTGDFHNLDKRLKQNNLNQELLIKAAKIKGENPTSLTLLDATAGMGDDSLLLAAFGFNVIMFERDPIIAALLFDSLNRAHKDPSLSDIAKRMTLVFGDSIEALKEKDYTPDVILLDPMFPERQKSGLIKKKFQLLQQLESPCDDEFSLMNAALYANPRKIIVKRPAKGPFLANLKPDHDYPGKAIRYDCYINITQHLVKLGHI